MELSIRQQPVSAPFATVNRATTALALVQRLAVWIQRSRGRRALQQLDERLLQDIGVSHAEARQEADKHFWTA